MGYDQERTDRSQPSPFNEAIQQRQILSTATFTGPTDEHDLIIRGFFATDLCIVKRFSVSKGSLGLVYLDFVSRVIPKRFFSIRFLVFKASIATLES